MSHKKEGRPFENYNSQAGLFAQSSKEMYLLLDVFGCTAERNIFLGIGDLYVTVFGGRNRRLGTLLGKGFTYDESMAQLGGVTFEGIVITERTAVAVEQLAGQGIAFWKQDDKRFVESI